VTSCEKVLLSTPFRLRKSCSKLNIEVRSQNSADRMMRKPAKTFQDLVVWQKAHQFVLAVYQLTQNFSKSELYGLTSQFRRAAVSIPANIAEGFRKRGKADKVRFFNISQGSLEEARYYLILAKDLEYADISRLWILIEEVSKLLEAYSLSILTSDT
jgi:four helix bundle protein